MLLVDEKPIFVFEWLKKFRILSIYNLSNRSGNCLISNEFRDKWSRDNLIFVFNAHILMPAHTHLTTMLKTVPC